MDNVTPNTDSWELADEVKHDFEEAGYTSADYPLNERIAVALTVYANKKIAELRPEPTAGDAKKPLTARALLNSGLVGIWKGREPTAGDQEAARKIFDEIHCKYLGCLDADFGVTEASEQAELVIADALSAARGNRAELEAAARESREALEVTRGLLYEIDETPDAGDKWAARAGSIAGAIARATMNINALAALVKAEEVQR
ncbi:MAG TPA: hypothetical protein VMW93_07215 [bacterium]|nr:hypothetical protein [bacterium]